MVNRLVPEPVVVVGAGIAGLALARALHQHDVPVTVLERRGQLPTSGLAINIPGNGMVALSKLGLTDALQQFGAPVLRREYRTDSDRLMYSIDEQAFWSQHELTRIVPRHGLLQVLAQDLPDGTIKFDSAAQELLEQPDGVTVKLTDGETVKGGFLVGADGVRSAVRSRFFGDEGQRKALLSEASWRFMAPNPGIDAQTIWMGPNHTFATIPAGNGEVYCFASALGKAKVTNDETWLQKTFADYPSPVRAILAHLRDGDITLHHSSLEEVRISTWSQGRVALIGDAAHATAAVWAQGAALAVEDALVLADLISREGMGPEVGAAYVARRRERVQHVQKMTDRASRAAALPAWLRRLILPRFGPGAFRSTYTPLKDAVL